MAKQPAGRAFTDSTKRAVIERIYAAWCRTPDLRLGQLIENASYGLRPNQFNVEDERLARDLEAFVKRHAK